MHLFYFSGFSGCTLAWQVSFPASEHCCVFKSVPLPCREPLGGRTPCSQRVLLFGRWAVGEGGMLAIVSDLTRIGQAGLCSIRRVFWRWLGERGRGGGCCPDLARVYYPRVWRPHYVPAGFLQFDGTYCFSLSFFPPFPPSLSPYTIAAQIPLQLGLLIDQFIFTHVIEMEFPFDRSSTKLEYLLWLKPDHAPFCFVFFFLFIIIMIFKNYMYIFLLVLYRFVLLWTWTGPHLAIHLLAVDSDLSCQSGSRLVQFLLVSDDDDDDDDHDHHINHCHHSPSSGSNSLLQFLDPVRRPVCPR